MLLRVYKQGGTKRDVRSNGKVAQGGQSEERANIRLEMAISTATKMIKSGKYSD